MTLIPPKTFYYSEIDGGEKTRSIVIPHTGFLEAIAEHLSKLRNAKVEFNVTRALSGEVADYCIQCIEEAHASRSSKANKLLDLYDLMRHLDDKNSPENIKRAVNFLLDNACLIGDGIVSDIRIPEISAQLHIGARFIATLKDLSASRYLEHKENVITELLDTYSCYLEKFFQFGQPKNDLSQSQLNASKNLMRVCGAFNIETPDFFKDVRLKVLNGFAKQAFDIVSNPDLKSGWQIYHLISELESVHFKLDLKPEDPISFVRDGVGGSLLRVKHHGGQMVYLFNTEAYSISARTERELRERVAGVHGRSGRFPAETIDNLLKQIAPV